MDRKKQRGQKRRLKALCDNINEIQPFQNTKCRYEHFHVPCSRFISSPKTSAKTKTAFCKAWLNKTNEIIKLKPDGISFCKVVAVIDEFDFGESQIIIFYDKDYYHSFWQRDSDEQKWSPIVKQEISLIQKRNIKSNLKEKGYYEELTDIGYNKTTRLWFYGDVN